MSARFASSRRTSRPFLCFKFRAIDRLFRLMVLKYAEWSCPDGFQIRSSPSARHDLVSSCQIMSVTSELGFASDLLTYASYRMLDFDNVCSVICENLCTERALAELARMRLGPSMNLLLRLSSSRVSSHLAMHLRSVIQLWTRQCRDFAVVHVVSGNPSGSDKERVAYCHLDTCGRQSWLQLHACC